MGPPYLYLFAEGHEEAERRVPCVRRTWHFIPPKHVVQARLCLRYALFFSVVKVFHIISGFNHTARRQKEKFRENVKLKGKVKAVD